MGVKKSQLYSSPWQSCDELRGGMDASQYKDYVLVMLFVKYVSDKYAGQLFAPIQVPDGASFADMVELKGDPNIGDKLNKLVLGPLFKANNLSTPPDFNDATKLGTGKEMVQRLTNLIAIFENPELDFSKNRADGDDLLGDAYEYLMRHFATESGKSKGQFYTPSEVSRVMAQVLGIRDATTTRSTTVYDPTCGSGSLLLKVGGAARTDVTLYGQEKDSTTAGLARMNMILHNQPTAEIRQGNTLANPLFLDGGSLKTFDFVVANPPFSDKRWSTGIDPHHDAHGRFKQFGVPPGKQGDYAYLLHIVRSLRSTGKGACILPHGVLFRGNAEAEIRRNLVKRGLIKAIIGLPANLFYGTGIPACIVVIDKDGAAARDAIFMVDASKGFIKDGNKNRLREMDIHRIVDVFTRQSEDDPRYARLVPRDEIERNEFNLNIPRYIDSQEAEDIQDIDGHRRGGIPTRDVDDQARYWAVCPGLRSALFTERRPGYVDITVDKRQLKTAIFEHSEFATFTAGMQGLFDAWRSRVAAELKGLAPAFHPKELIVELGEGLLAHYEGKPLVDHYAVYQHLMDYWVETMQDDAYLLSSDGWKAKTHRVMEKVKSGKKKGEFVDRGWACDLVPKAVLVGRFFKAELAKLRELRGRLESATAAQTELEEQHGGDSGALSAVGNKTEAEAALREAIEAVWAESDPDEFKTYERATRDTEAQATLLPQLADGPFLRTCRNAKGKLALGAIKARLKASGRGEEAEALEGYLACDAALKRHRKTARGLYETAAAAVMERMVDEPEAEELEDLRVLTAYLDAVSEISLAKSEIKTAEATLDAKAYAQYSELTEDDVKALVVDDKWLATLSGRIYGELDRISQALTHRVGDLAERYEIPLPEAVAQVDALQAKVASHLKRMGFA
jgi:type I restriction enzyme M protein